VSDSYRRILDRADDFFAEVARRLPGHLECREGCTKCCHGLFEIGTADVSLVTEGIRALDPETRAAVVERARRLVEDLAQPNLRHCEPEAKEAFFERAEDAPCPALDEAGSCLIYEHRPVVCRTFGVPLRDGTKYMGQECDLNFTAASEAEKRSAAWNLAWEDVLGPEDEFTIPEAIVLAALFTSS
jgi:Fe-S-cluster containining protein